MSKEKIKNFISKENNEKISFFTSENNSYVSSNILSDIEKVIKTLLFIYYFFNRIFGFLCQVYHKK